MTIEETLFAVLGDMVGGRVFPDEAPANVPRPFVIYQQVGGDPFSFLEGAADVANGRFQIAVWSGDRGEAGALSRAIAKRLIDDPRTRATPVSGALSSREPLTGLYGLMQDFSIWFDV
ncbi:DUF3168 domain-containing protein [Cupriavidus respiraculi]|uniref:DUF3168 domain-containing protein n=1 Tax=Cupriavidus respiraculi TaxID=195930 RepID=A0ABM8XV61_9BURK|nr:DUF3168 domain-containing protein [Cupriavidus respiraculi]CAG9184277.1 hypothetical protein LMG21510_05057 [Cupriavidus respiraculi]